MREDLLQEVVGDGMTVQPYPASRGRGQDVAEPLTQRGGPSAQHHTDSREARNAQHGTSDGTPVATGEPGQRDEYREDLDGGRCTESNPTEAGPSSRDSHSGSRNRERDEHQ